ncbi:hypothetical protein P7C71_g3494, partial [Lecanoromycetidae sp. Uapishka_2]
MASSKIPTPQHPSKNNDPLMTPISKLGGSLFNHFEARKALSSSPAYDMTESSSSESSQDSLDSHSEDDGMSGFAREESSVDQEMPYKHERKTKKVRFASNSPPRYQSVLRGKAHDMEDEVGEKDGGAEEAKQELERQKESDEADKIAYNFFSGARVSNRLSLYDVLFPGRRPISCLPLKYALYNTAYYKNYDPQDPTPEHQVQESFKNYGQYNKYTLFTDHSVTDIEEVPKKAVRLDDMALALVLSSCAFKTRELSKNWGADIDTKGMVRTTRCPLGYAAKIWKNEGDKDCDGKNVPNGEAGWYYQWWGGIHALMGEEGLDAGLYDPCGSHQSIKTKGLSFKIGSKAIIQLPSGDPADPTFQ